MNTHLTRFSLAIVTCFVWVSLATANFEVSPFVLKLRADKGELSGWLEVKPNQNKRPVAVELALFERNLDLDGIEDQNSPESQELTIYPSELVVYPGEKVKVQVNWAGKSQPIADKTFTLLAKEVPVDINDPEAKDKVEINIKTLIKYRLVIAIETGKRGSLSVVSSKIVQKGKVEIIVENKGAGRIPMDGFHLMIGGKKYADFPGIGNAIMPGDKRRFILPLDAAPAPADIRFGAADSPLK
jgi:fimbrial chaperone protein